MTATGHPEFAYVAGFPMTIPKGETIHVLMAHPRIIQRRDPLFDFSASSEKDLTWPSERDARPISENTGGEYIKFSAVKNVQCKSMVHQS